MMITTTTTALHLGFGRIVDSASAFRTHRGVFGSGVERHRTIGIIGNGLGLERDMCDAPRVCASFVVGVFVE